MPDKRNRVYGLFAMGLMMLVIGQGCPLNPDDDPCSVPEVRTLIQEATTRVQQTDPNAIVYSVGGTNGANLCGEGSMTLTYTFMAVNPENDATYWILTYDAVNQTWSSEELAGPLVGVGYVDLTGVTLSETQARALLANAGHADDFLQWSLYQPLHPDFPNPLYGFNYADKSVTIDTVTQEVTVMTAGETEEPPLGWFPGEDSVSVEYVAQADARIKEAASNAFIIWAGGRDGASEPLNAPGETNVWNFLAIALNDPEIRAWRLTYDGEWTVEEWEGVPFGVTFVDMAVVTMDVVEAWGLALDAGYQPPFNCWELFQPLYPGVVNPEYVFTVPGGYIFVDTVTGEVTFE
ncbi:MAG: hypothetical protein GXY44_07195 [Phycisphaerales bacterium]|nr:hypothetical protein [Phycisphaerales bacterium]